jgi:hypothetical protein
MRQTAFVKVSGDLCRSPRFINWLRNQGTEYFVVVCVGGGTQINKGFEEAGIKTGPHGPLGRETKTFAERQLARNILETNQADLQDLLAVEGITATVTIPVLDMGSVLCHVNGDQMVRTAYLGFDKLFVITTSSRQATKAVEFTELPKVEVLGF